MINLISKDLRKEEVYLQIADCLDYLEKITAESFGQVNAKLNSINDDLIKIERRREIVKLKIEQIKKNNHKAIRIYSPFYYPAKEIKDQYKYESSIKSIQLTKTPQNYAIKQPLELFHPDDLNEMLNFCDLDTFLKTERESLNFSSRSKLNKSTIPWNRIKSISSLIIFNSSETAYIKSDLQDSSIYEFKTANKQKKIEEDDELNFGEYAPPISMTKKDKFDDFEQNLFAYDEQEAPKILDNLPNDLPDLGAVADDIFFKEDKASITHTNVQVDEEKEAEKSKQLPSKLFRIFSFDQSSTSSIEEIKPKEISNSNEGKETATVSQSIPPPPPLPNISSFESSTESEQKKPVEKKPIITIDNSRANLLDAIRKAGGKPDKSISIKEKKLEERKNRKESIPIDHMSDLKRHLELRRKKMAPSSKSNVKIQKNDSSDVYKTINKMIPSPESSEQSSESEIDDDWVNN